MTDRRAFTLVEMLACVALLSMLMVTLLSVTASLRRTTQQLRDTTPYAAALEPFEILIQRDLRHAQHVTVAEGRITFQSLSWIDPMSHEAIHRPVTVQYALDSASGMLLRHQRDMTDPTSHTSVEIVLTGVQTFSVRTRPGMIPSGPPSLEMSVAFSGQASGWEVTLAP